MNLISKFFAVSVLFTCQLGAHAACELFTFDHQSGQSFKLTHNQAIANLKELKLNNALGLPPDFNDSISSVLVTQRCSLHVWTDANYKGRTAEFHSDPYKGYFSTNLAAYQFDNNISSAYCYCR